MSQKPRLKKWKCAEFLYLFVHAACFANMKGTMMKKTRRIMTGLVFIGLFMLPSVIFSQAMPDTGQTACYDAAGNVLDPCPAMGEDFYGQDCQYQPQHPRSYTKLGIGGVELAGDALHVDDGGPWIMTRDNVTGLVWEVKAIANMNDTYTWEDATDVFIVGLNATNFGGHNNWRLPTIKELAIIANLGTYSASIDTEWFPNTVSPSWYWSSMEYAGNTSYAWGIDFYYGSSGNLNKVNSLYVRAVRGERSGLLGDLPTPNHFHDNSDGTVTDTFTGLMWQRASSLDFYNWQDALAYSENLNSAGHSDWRLPNCNELITLVDFTEYNPAIDTDSFPDTLSSPYWSSTTFASGIDQAWRVSFLNGKGSGYEKTNTYYARAVRGGQSGSLGNLVILTPRQASSWDIGSVMPICWETDQFGPDVKISLSRQGGLDGTFETIAELALNFGQYDWTIIGEPSVNCVIKIEDTDNSALWVSEGLFVIFGQSSSDTDSDGLSDDIENDPSSCTDFNDADTDNDGIIDGDEDVNQNGFVDGGETDPCDADTDGDGVQDGTEQGVTTGHADTDPAIFQPNEDDTTTTDPLNPDSDHDGLVDGQEDVNSNGLVDAGERDPNNMRDYSFSASSANISNPFMPSDVENIGTRINYGGFGTWDGYSRYIETVGIEFVDGVECVKFLVKGHGNDPDPDLDPEWYYVWLAEDTDQCLWILQAYNSESDQTFTHGVASAFLIMPADPVVGQIILNGPDYSEIMSVNASVPLLGTGAGPFSGCLEIKVVKSGATGEETEYYALGNWTIKHEMNSGAYGWETEPDSNQLPADDFDDNSLGDMWSLIEDDPKKVWLEETNQRLEARATTEMSEATATCISNQWQLSTGQDFSTQIDWRHLSLARDAGLFFAITIPNMLEETFIGLSVERKDDTGFPEFICDGSTNGNEFFDYDILRMVNDGIFYISYNSTNDRLYLSINGYWRAEDPATGDWVFEGLLKGAWQRDSVMVSFGFWNDENTAYISGDAYFDNFQVTQGSIIGNCDDGDINCDGNIDLTDAILSLKIAVSINPDQPIFKFADVNNDGKIGIEEAIIAIQVVAGIE